MKPISALLLLAFAPLLAQTAPSTTKPAIAATVKKPVTATAATSAAHSAACAKLPELSPKIPAVPAGSTCARTLYTLTPSAPVKLSDVSPMENAASLREIFGLETSPISLNYIDTKIGTGPLAAPHKWYSVHYTGYLTDGTIFDSSSKHPESDPFVFEVDKHQVIAGWFTGFGGMHVGGKRRLFIPSQLAYGARNQPGIPPKSDLVFDIELVAQSDTDPTPKPPAPPIAPQAPITPATPPPSTAPAPAPTPKPTQPQ